MMGAKQFFKAIVEEEQSLRELLKVKSSTSREANGIRKSMVEKAEALTALDAKFASGKEIERLLWKPCFYERIEDFRRQIRKYAVAAASDPKLQDHFRRIQSEFHRFVDDASAFYDRLQGYFRKRLEDSYGSKSISQRNKCRQSSYRCFVFLGDLARYRELHSQKSKKDFSSAEGYYHQALAIMPEQGNPHNQLAVVATYMDAECVAVYRYCRSLLVVHPFLTSEENLALLYARNRQKLAGSNLSNEHIKLNLKSKPKEKSMVLKRFLSEFVQAHGIIFTAIKKLEGKAKDPSKDIENTTDILSNLKSEFLFLKDLSVLLQATAIGDALLLKLVVICIFSIYRSRNKNEIDGNFQMIHSNSLILGFNLLGKVMSFVVSHSMPLNNMDKSIKKRSSTSSNLNALALRVLGPISVFCQFLNLHSEYFVQHHNDDAFQKALKEFLSYVASLSTVVYTLLKDYIEENGTSMIEQWKGQKQNLKEYIELRGFVPLIQDVDLKEKIVKESYHSSLQTTSVSDLMATIVRIQLFLEFCDTLTTSSNFMNIILLSKDENNIYSIVTSSDVEENLYNNDDILNNEECLDVVDSGLDMIEDDIDDEVIVFQPSFSKNKQDEEPSSHLDRIDETNDEIFSLDPSKMNSNSLFGYVEPMETSTTHEEYNMFGSDSRTSSFLNTFGWNSMGISLSNNNPSIMTTSSTSDSPFTALPTSHFNSVSTCPSTSSWLGDSKSNTLSDLDAIEMETRLYENAESSLSAFMNPIGRSPMNSTSSNTLSIPPPGFENVSAPPGFYPSNESKETKPTNSSSSRIFTKNPFVIGKS